MSFSQYSSKTHNYHTHHNHNYNHQRTESTSEVTNDEQSQSGSFSLDHVLKSHQSRQRSMGRVKLGLPRRLNQESQTPGPSGAGGGTGGGGTGLVRSTSSSSALRRRPQPLMMMEFEQKKLDFEQHHTTMRERPIMEVDEAEAPLEAAAPEVSNHKRKSISQPSLLHSNNRSEGRSSSLPRLPQQMSLENNVIVVNDEQYAILKKIGKLNGSLKRRFHCNFILQKVAT